MTNRLYLICPTDYLEPIINRTYRSANYFYSSLGNSFVYDTKTIEYLKHMIKKQNIREICFVLSMDNQFIVDALDNQDFSDIGRLHHFYDEIRKQKKHSEVLWQSNNHQFSIVSYYLNKKIKDFQHELDGMCTDRIKISGKIYNKQAHVFDTIYSHLICLEHFRLNEVV